MELPLEIHRYKEALIRILYPSSCGGCHAPLDLDQEHLCSDCEAEADHLRFACFRRALPLKSDFLDEAWALYPYQGVVQKIVQGVKLSGKSWLLHHFKAICAEWAWSLHAENRYDAVLPVPLHKFSRIERRFNQSEILARDISKSTGLRAETHLLLKSSRTPSQRRLNREERLANLSGAFRLSNPKQAFGKKFLLIDDVMTTGATAEECARTLKGAGADKVDFMALAYTTGEGPA